MLAPAPGFERLPLNPRVGGPLRALVADIGRIAGYPLEVGKTAEDDQGADRRAALQLGDRRGDARLPLIVDDGRLYTERARSLEIRVALRLAARIATRTRVAAHVLANLRNRPGAVWRCPARAGGRGRARARRRARGRDRRARHRQDAVAASMVRGLARLGIAPIALAAQTGKAANRLTTMIAEQLAAIAAPSDVDRALAEAPPIAQTLHRLLGARGGHFAHHAQSPLPVGR